MIILLIELELKILGVKEIDLIKNGVILFQMT
jgi:hypothetical protein